MSSYVASPRRRTRSDVHVIRNLLCVWVLVAI
jgi:uncharacterized membrane protein